MKRTVTLVLLAIAISAVIPAHANILISNNIDVPGVLDDTRTNTTIYGKSVNIYVQQTGHCYTIITYKRVPENGTLTIQSLDTATNTYYLPPKDYLENITDTNTSANTTYITKVEVLPEGSYYLVFNVTANHTYRIYYDRGVCAPSFSSKVLIDNGTINLTQPVSLLITYGNVTWYVLSFASNYTGTAYLYSRYVSMGFNVDKVLENGANITYITKTGSLWIIFNVTSGNSYTVYTYNTSSLSLGGGGGGGTANAEAPGAVVTTTAFIEEIKVLLVKQKDIVFWGGVILLALLILLRGNRKRR